MNNGILRTSIIVALLIFANISYAINKDHTLAVDLNGYPYFFSVSYLKLSIQKEDLRMAYMDIKPATPNGKSVLLLHGKNFSGNYWKQTAQKLAEQGYRVIIPDQVGFGKSSKPQHIQYSFQMLAENTKALLDTLQINNMTVVGHSMGGMLATRFALMYPATVSKLVLVCPLGLEDYKLIAPYQTIDERYKAELAQNYDKLKKYMQENYFHGTWKPEYEALLDIPSGWFNNKDYAQIAFNSALTYDMIFTQPVVYEIPKLSMPTLLIVGSLDHTAIGKELVSDNVKKNMGDFQKLGPAIKVKNKNITLAELNTGHLPQVEAFDDFYRTLNSFLKN